MTNRISETFTRLGDRTAFVAYLTAGDPDLATTVRLLDALASEGADIIELGVPFSDPMADGPVIEAAMGRALAHGVTFADVLEVVRTFRATHADTPIVLFGYTNPIHAYGLDAAARDARDAGADGFLVVDLPPEESAQLVDPLRANGLDFIALFTPTSDDARIATIARSASGFAYYVSMGGVTGDALTDLETVAVRTKAVRRLSGLPVCVGFGIREPEDAVRVAAFADGVVVGTRIVQTIADAPTPDAAVTAIAALTRRFREALDAR